MDSKDVTSIWELWMAPEQWNEVLWEDENGDSRHSSNISAIVKIAKRVKICKGWDENCWEHNFSIWTRLQISLKWTVSWSVDYFRRNSRYSPLTMKLISCETQLWRKIIESCGNHDYFYHSIINMWNRVDQLRDVFQLCNMEFRYKIPPR